MHLRDETRRMCEDLDRLEADMVRMQSRLWSIRQKLQERIGEKIGFQYDHPNERSSNDFEKGQL